MSIRLWMTLILTHFRMIARHNFISDFFKKHFPVKVKIDENEAINLQINKQFIN